MSISHTPGPWKWLSNKRQGGRMLVAADESEIVLARATCHKDQSREQGLRRLANVKLIAAAPELLAALKMVLANERTWDNGPDSIGPTWVRRAEAAIRAAE